MCYSSLRQQRYMSRWAHCHLSPVIALLLSSPANSPATFPSLVPSIFPSPPAPASHDSDYDGNHNNSTIFQDHKLEGFSCTYSKSFATCFIYVFFPRIFLICHGITFFGRRGGVNPNPLKKFAYPMQFLPDLTPLEVRTRRSLTKQRQTGEMRTDFPN
jgi:hypothetical protein